jgi:ABC-type lipopolysaccharide export system ATPase subunit
MTELAICVEKLTREFKQVKAVENLSLEVPSGIIFGFLGPNGGWYNVYCVKVGESGILASHHTQRGHHDSPYSGYST